MNKKIIAKINKIPWILGSRAFLVILIMIFLEIIIGAFIFYKYALPLEKGVLTGNSVIFEYNTYEQVLKGFEARDKRIKED